MQAALEAMVLAAMEVATEQDRVGVEPEVAMVITVRHSFFFLYTYLWACPEYKDNCHNHGGEKKKNGFFFKNAALLDRFPEDFLNVSSATTLHVNLNFVP